MNDENAPALDPDGVDEFLRKINSKTKLEDHADLIKRLLARGFTAYRVWQYMRGELGLDVSRSTVLRFAQSLRAEGDNLGSLTSKVDGSRHLTRPNRIPDAVNGIPSWRSAGAADSALIPAVFSTQPSGVPLGGSEDSHPRDLRASAGGSEDVAQSQSVPLAEAANHTIIEQKEPAGFDRKPLSPRVEANVDTSHSAFGRPDEALRFTLEAASHGHEDASDPLIRTFSSRTPEAMRELREYKAALRDGRTYKPLGRLQSDEGNDIDK